MPLAEEPRFITGLLKVRRKEDRAIRNCCVVIDDAVAMRIDASEDRGTARTAQGRRDKCVFEVNAFVREAIELRGLQPRLRLKEPERVITMIIAQNKDYVSAPGILRCR